MSAGGNGCFPRIFSEPVSHRLYSSSPPRTTPPRWSQSRDPAIDQPSRSAPALDRARRRDPAHAGPRPIGHAYQDRHFRHDAGDPLGMPQPVLQAQDARSSTDEMGARSQRSGRIRPLGDHGLQVVSAREVGRETGPDRDQPDVTVDVEPQAVASQGIPDAPSACRSRSALFLPS